MNTSFTTARFFVMYCALFGIAASAADHVNLQQVSDWMPAENSGPDSDFRVAQSDLQNGAFDNRAQGLLKASEKFTGDTFNFSALRFLRAATYRNGNNDEMVAEWSFNEPFGNGKLLLRDTPFLSKYVIQISHCACNSSEDVARILTTLVRWGKPPINLGAIDIRLSASYPKFGAFSGGPWPPASEAAVIGDFDILGLLKDQDLYLDINVGKSFTTSYYPLPPFIPERFPPLSDLLNSWSSRTIWQEIGRPAGPTSDIDLSERRDAVLITELARRGISEDEYLQLLRNVAPARLYSRALVVFQSFEEAGKGGDAVSYFGPTVEMYEKLGPASADAVRELFKTVLKRTGCSPGLESRAMRLLASGGFDESALTYLDQCSTSPDALRRIEETSVQDRFGSLREMAIRDIRKRLPK